MKCQFFSPAAMLKPAAKLLLTLACLAAVLGLGGCSVSQTGGEKVKDLEFSVIGREEIPQELGDMIASKEGAAFKLTYSDGQNLYIAVGCGEQESGGYSIRVNELYLTSNSIVLDTELLGPQKGEQAGTEKSRPYLVLKTEYSELPVIFQ